MKTKNIVTQVTTSTLAQAVFYGIGQLVLDHTSRTYSFNVCNHLADRIGHNVKFRWITKVKAGWNTIQEFTEKPEHLMSRIGKNVQCIQVQQGEHWFDIYNLKNGLWANIDVTLLDRCTVGDIRQGSPKMASNRVWEQVKAKTWADLAFVPNKK